MEGVAEGSLVGLIVPLQMYLAVLQPIPSIVIPTAANPKMTNCLICASEQELYPDTLNKNSGTILHVSKAASSKVLKVVSTWILVYRNSGPIIRTHSLRVRQPSASHARTVLTQALLRIPEE